ncbi:radical SAM domain-containing protein, partial [mine drainage metagenome]
PGGKVRCTACARYCTLPDGARGFCFVRQNVGGRLELLTYGRVAALQVDPVEKKPLAHYRPGTRVLSLGTSGCNWRCRYCQNWQISQEHEAGGRPLSPGGAVQLARHYGCSGVTFTYNEPTIFAEYAREIMRAAQRTGLFTNFVTNGYLSPEALEFRRGHLD